jgi:uncharacterized protein (DUF58 family)
MPATLAPAEFEKIASLHLFARQVVEGFCSGLHRSPHKGFSVEFKEHRQYVPGDEIRRLDWKVFGKTDRFYIREFEEETNLRATLLLDCSGSMSYAGDETAPLDDANSKGRETPRAGTGSSGAFTKHDYAVRVAACLAYLMIQQQDSVGLVTFADRLRTLIPPRSRASHLGTLLGEMQASEIGGESELGNVFQHVAPKLARRGLLIILSDCFCNVAELLRSLAHLRHARHEIIIFQIWHRDELEFPFRQWTRFDCLEQSSYQHLVDPAHVRAAYMDNLARFRDELTQGCHRHRVELVPMTTDRPVGDALAEYLARRRRIRKR